MSAPPTKSVVCWSPPTNAVASSCDVVLKEGKGQGEHEETEAEAVVAPKRGDRLSPINFVYVASVPSPHNLQSAERKVILVAWTKIFVISGKGEYLGGAIVPGVMIASEALFQRASRLPRVEIFKAPSTVIGKDTIESIKSGIIYGNAAMVDGMVERMSKEMGETPKILATGGLAPLISELSNTIEKVEQSLTLEGLRLIYNSLEA